MYEGVPWRLTTSEPGNGYATKVNVIAHGELEDTVGGIGSSAPPAAITQAAATGDLVVAAITVESGVANFSVTNMTVLRERVLGSHKVMIAAAFWNISAVPAVVDGSGTRSRVEWLLLRGVDPTALGGTTFDTGADAVSYYTSFGTQVPFTHLGQLVVSTMAAQFGASTDAKMVTNRNGDLTDLRRIGRNDTFPAGAFTSFLSSTHIGRPVMASSLYVGNEFWRPSIINPTTLDWAMVGFVVKPASTPWFDKTVWKRMPAPVGSGTVVDLVAWGFEPNSISVAQIPEEDRAYTLAMNPMFNWSIKPLQLRPPTPAVPGEAHWLRLSVSVPGYSSTSSLVTMRTTWAGLAVKPSDANFRHNGVLVEPGCSPGSRTTIDLEWDPLEAAWSVSDWRGDAIVRDYGMSPNSLDEDLGVRLFFSPELKLSADYVTVRNQHIDALRAIPSSTRQLMAAAKVSAWIINSHSGAWNETIYHRVISTIDAAGWSMLNGLYAETFAMAKNVPDTIPARVMLHELGHAWDYTFYTARGLEGAISTNQAWIDLWTQVTDKSGSPLRNAAHEWLAEILFLHWCRHIPGFDSAMQTAMDQKTSFVVNGNLALFDSAITYLRSIGAIRAHDNW
jgi:hypothetical protein